MELIEYQTILTVIAYCPICEKNKNATRGTKFLMHDGNEWHDMVATKKSHTWGFVPHIYKLERVLEDGTVHATFSCAVESCGSNWEKVKDVSYIMSGGLKNDTWHLTIPKEKYKPVTLSAKSWNHLVMNPYHLEFEADFLD